uniref:Uncharacterized protein n=1 Tax=Cyanistes caeruleus TaxID=156563 RepID=A0A8C0U3U5_CYACU
FNKAAANIAVEAGQVGGLRGGRDTRWDRNGVEGRGGCLGSFSGSCTHTSEWLGGLPGWAAPSSQGAVEQAGLGNTFPTEEVPVLAACGHCRGARHGLTMSAKLARLEEQERAFLATYRQRERHQEPPENSQGKKKERKRSRDGANPEVPHSQKPNTKQEEVLEEEKVVKRKKKNRGPSREEELTGEEEVKRKKKKKKMVMEPCGEEVSGEEGKVMKRRKKPELSTEEEVVEEEGKAAKRRKKKKKKKQEEEDKEEPAETDVPPQDTDESNLGHSPTKKRKKRRKREPE